MSAALWPPWPPPDKKQRPERGGHRAGPQPVARTGKQNNNTLGRGNGQYDRPFIVIVRLWNRCNEYGKYATCAAADAEVAKLTKLNFHAERVAR